MEYSKKVLVWLFVGLVMVFVQVLVGGITRLTESGLSITKWEVVSGTIPPTSEGDWLTEFELYKETPQYKEINEGMSLSDFKFIYFWEFIHRFWARIMGFVFIIPFLWFYFKGYLDKAIKRNLGIVVLLAMLAATFGWIMVASGLIERPWVNAYKLSIHLCIAFGVFGYLLWTFLKAKNPGTGLERNLLSKSKNLIWIFFSILVIQIFFGGVMSGMKAAVIVPTWPDLNGSYFPDVLFYGKEWNSENFNNYDKNLFMPVLIHFIHRGTAYILFVLGCMLSYRLFNAGRKQKTSQNYLLTSLGLILFLCLTVQVILGIITVLTSIGKIPVLWGVLHQGMALLLLSTTIFTIFITVNKK